MKPELYLHIPTPCHEDWNTMTPVEKGKFCGSCNKEVVDFSLMTDAEVLNFFKKQQAILVEDFLTTSYNARYRKRKLKRSVAGS